MRRSARIAASLFAMVATASCSSSDGLAPPIDVGGGETVASTDPAVAPPVAVTTTQATSPSVGAAGSAPITPQGDGGPIAAVTVPSRIQFAPIVGSTVEAVTPLTQRLAERARTLGIGLTGKGGDGATHILRGYFSAISEGGATTVIYVWDVLDTSGNRLHRIQGQAKAEGRGEGWSAVPPATMQSIADRTIDAFAQWLSTRAS